MRLICAVLLVLLPAIASAQTVAVGPLVAASARMGERTPAPGLVALVRAGAVDLRGVFDSSDKAAGGWLVRGVVEGRVGRLRVGADYTHRDGGTWAKEAAWWRIGVGGSDAHGSRASVVYRGPLWGSANNTNRVASVIGRVEVPAGRVLVVLEPAVHRFTQGGRRLTGWSVDTGVAWRLR